MAQRWFALCLSTWMIVASATTVQRRTLVILEELSQKENYSQFFQILTDRKHELSFHTPQDSSVSLQIFGEYQYENLIVFSPKIHEFAAFDKSKLLEFVESGGNVLIASGVKLSKTLRDIAAESGVEFHKKSSTLMDHFQYNAKSDDLNHITIHANSFIKSPVVVGENLAKNNGKSYIVFKGIGQKLEEDNVLTFSVLQAPVSTYAASPGKPIINAPDGAGQQISLVSAVQARNNARLIFSGSIDLFSNEFFDMEVVDQEGKSHGKSSNKEFCEALSKWGFNEVGVLRAREIRHNREDGSQPAKMLSNLSRPDLPTSLYPDAEVARDSLVYRIKDNLTYSFTLEQFQNDKWVPFKANDVQLEFVMLDPYVRKTMSHNNQGRFSVTFQSPDDYGIFKFRVMYRRLGYSTIHIETQISLRPFKHDEYERFIISAFPYYTSAFSMMAGVFIFSILFLFGGLRK